MDSGDLFVSCRLNNYGEATITRHYQKVDIQVKEILIIGDTQMTTIAIAIMCANTIRSLKTKKEKLAYTTELSDSITSLLGGHVNMNGVGNKIAEKINVGQYSDSLETIVEVFDTASKISGRLDKEAIISSLTLTANDKEFIFQCLYPSLPEVGSLKLGITVPQRTGFGSRIKPALAESKTFDPQDYIVEQKYDGHRILIRKDEAGIVHLTTRNGKDANVEAIKREAECFLPEGTILDGEVVAANGDFQSLDIHGGDTQYKAFDILFVDGQSVMNKSFTQRRNVLEGVVDFNSQIQLSEILDLSTMSSIDNWIQKTGAEGIMAKDPNGVYRTGKRDWVKYKQFFELNSKVIGFEYGKGKRANTIGSLFVQPEGLTGITKVGTGFSDSEMATLLPRLIAGETFTCRVQYQNITRDGKLRFPVFLGLV